MHPIRYGDLAPLSRFIAAHLGAPISVLAEQASEAARVFTDSWNKFLFRRFWGESISSRDVDLVIDSYENVVLRNRFRWTDSDHKQAQGFTGEVIPGTFSPQATSIEKRDGVTYDKAILLRLLTRQQDSSQCQVVCAGLSEWGSLAAVHYLVRNWKVLHRRFDGFGQRRDFCVLLEVPFGHCEEARELAAAVWWHRNGHVK